jgi:hypothetical protein
MSGARGIELGSESGLVWSVVLRNGVADNHLVLGGFAKWSFVYL